ncbi:MAG: hypothetical protein IKO14_00835, partial [Oscillibacter sp.]|nr:hypothetical protein [Oscillibacter sp.]
GGGGGGGGGSSTTRYYLKVNAFFAPFTGGKVYLTQTIPEANNVIPTTADAMKSSGTFFRNNERGTDVSVYAVFVPNPNYTYSKVEADPQTTTLGNATKLDMYRTSAKAASDKVTVTYVQVTASGSTVEASAPSVTVRGYFTTGTTPQPTEKTWTVSASGTGAYFQLAKTQAELATTEVTSNSGNSVTVEKVVDGTESEVFLAVSPQADYEFGNDAQLQYTGVTVKPLSATDKLQVYQITRSEFKDAKTTTTLTMNLSKKDNAQQPDELEYKVKLVIEGKGSVALKAGNETLTEAKEVTVKMTKSEYTSRYPNRSPKSTEEYVLPVFLTSMPVADKGYKYEGKVSYNGTERDAKVFAANADTSGELSGVYFAAKSGETYTVTVKFDKLLSYGYNLTIIGNEKVTAEFNGGSQTYSGNADNTPKTYSSGLIVTDQKTLRLTLDSSFTKQSDGTYKKGNDATGFTAEKPVVDGTDMDYGQDIPLTENALTDIVVEIHKTTRELYKFTVKVETGTTGEVTVKSESGEIFKDAQKNKATDTDKVVKSGGETEFHAYEDTVITIVPKADDTGKVKSITVTPTASYTRDVMATAGYSFQLKQDDIKAVVAFGEFKDYSFLLQAPYGASKSAETHSQKITKDNTLQQILYSLNDGTSDKFMEATSGIENKFGAPTILNMFVKNYLTMNGVAKLKNGSFGTGAQLLQETLQDAIKPNITTMVPSIVEAKKADLNVDEIKASMKKAMEDEQNRTQPITITGDAKTQILSMIPGASALNANDITVTATPVISEAKAAELGIAGQSVQTQMEGFVERYLKAIRVQSGYENDLEPSVTVTASTSASDYSAVISATVSSTSGKWPTLDPSVTMTSYLDQLNVMVAINATQGSTNLLTTPKLVSSGEISGYNFTNTLEPLMKDVDAQVSTAWDDTFKAMLKDGKLPIDMTMVLAQDKTGKELLDGVVDQMIQPPSVTLTEKVGSLGDGEGTKAAILNIYRDFVVFDNTNPTTRLLYLKTNNESDKSYVVGKIDADKNFVLTYDFEKILRDTNQSDMVPYEQLADLILAVRNGMSEDIRTNPKNTNGQTAQSVIASLIEGKIGNVKAVKWGRETTDWTEAERKEISNLLAAFLMNSETSDNMGKLWADFENSGYTSVEFRVAMDASKRPGVSGFVDAFNKAAGASGSKLTVGFKVQQEFK